MILAREVTFLYLLAACVSKTQGQRITWLSIAHRYNSAYVRSLNSSITQPLQLGFNIEVDYLHDICEDYLYFEIKLPPSKKTGSVHLVNHKLKFTDFVKKSVKNNLYKIVYQSVEQYTNLPKKCPMPTNLHIYFRNFTVAADQFPIIASEMNMLVLFKMVRPNEELVLEVIIKVRLECWERKGFGCGFGVKRG